MQWRVGNNSIAEKTGGIFSAMQWRVGNNSIAEKLGELGPQLLRGPDGKATLEAFADEGQRFPGGVSVAK